MPPRTFAFITVSAVLSLWYLGPGVPGDRHAGRTLHAEDKPITLARGDVGDWLRQWYRQKTAAGNFGDYYDNRDRGHSELDLTLYPQLQKIAYTPDQVKARQDWGMQTRVLPQVVFGNSSTSASPTDAGSLPRTYYAQPRGLDFLFAQYSRNNLYIYPEHRDHDPGHNGNGGYGDLYPANSPYLIISQGSSGSDQAFLRVLPHVLAAFRPEVKQELIRKGMLMPVVQMLLRFTSRRLAGSSEYLTGKAHPTAFKGGDINPSRMVEMAHDMTLAQLPPIALIRTVREDTPVNGRDYFDPEHTEKLADTPALIARIVRGSQQLRRITVSAEESRDLNGRPLKFHWTVLRGDAARISIVYRNSSHSVADITVPYHARFPVPGESGLESNRVDIGVFVHNGTYYSPPALVTMYTLDSEARTYAADGRLLEIGYGAGAASVGVKNWEALFAALDPANTGWQAGFLRRQFTEKELAGLKHAAEEFFKAHALLLAARAKSDQAAAAPNAADIAEIRKALQSAQKLEQQALQNPIPKLNTSAGDLVQKVLNTLLQDPELATAQAAGIQRLRQTAGKEALAAVDQARQLLLRFGIAEESGGLLRWTLLRSGSAPMVQRLTRYEGALIARFNGALLAQLFFPEALQSAWSVNFVDARLAASKEWRDVYRYAPDGTPTGWQRYQADGTRRFNADGWLILQTDSQGRCLKAQGVRYDIVPRDAKTPRAPATLRMMTTGEMREYQYAGTDDWKLRPRADL